MNDLTTLPASIRERLEQAQALAQQNQGGDALGQAFVELARSDPALFALIMARRAGLNGIAWTTAEERSWTERVDYKFFGITYRTEYVPMAERTVTTRTVNFF